jgi:hypothetical protein
MKTIFNRLVSIVIVCVAAFSLNAQAASKDKGSAEITFAEKSHDFGTIQEAKGQVSHTFEFTNTGDGALVIIDATASCGCTRPEYPKEPIKPGKKGKIKVTYNPSHRPGEFSKQIKVRTNDSKHRRVTLKISGTVLPASGNN